MTSRRTLTAVTVTYLTVVHLVLIAALAKTDFLPRVARRVGLVPQHLAIEPWEADYKRQAAHLATVDGAIPPAATVFLGDSLIYGLYVPAVVGSGINMGIPGETAGRLADRAAGYRCLQSAGTVVVLVGVNDVSRGRTTAELADDYARLLATIPSGPSVICLGILPVDERAAALLKGRNARIADANNAIQKVVAARGGCRFVDLSTPLADQSGNLIPTYHNTDGVHLSQAGYEVLVRELRAILSRS